VPRRRAAAGPRAVAGQAAGRPGPERLLEVERAIPTRTWQDESAVRRRLTQELAVIAKFNLSNYFVTVAEIAGESRRQGWPMSLRGSAGSSLVCYLLSITDVDPLRHGLRLERFLHAGRASVPDIDLDFASQYRSQLFTWVVKHFGQAHTARVGLWQKFGPRSAFAAAAAAHGVTPAQMRPLTEALGDDVERLADADDTCEALAVPPPTFPLGSCRVAMKIGACVFLVLGRPSAGADPREWTLEERRDGVGHGLRQGGTDPRGVDPAERALRPVHALLAGQVARAHFAAPRAGFSGVADSAAAGLVAVGAGPRWCCKNISWHCPHRCAP
jgi:hypothetical protein